MAEYFDLKQLKGYVNNELSVDEPAGTPKAGRIAVERVRKAKGKGLENRYDKRQALL